jgi:prepilin-type N-terminal cleavage/methylation domain-containing protein
MQKNSSIQQHGATLIELLITMTISSVLFASTIPLLRSAIALHHEIIIRVQLSKSAYYLSTLWNARLRKHETFFIHPDIQIERGLDLTERADLKGIRQAARFTDAITFTTLNTEILYLWSKKYKAFCSDLNTRSQPQSPELLVYSIYSGTTHINRWASFDESTECGTLRFEELTALRPHSIIPIERSETFYIDTTGMLRLLVLQNGTIKENQPVLRVDGLSLSRKDNRHYQATIRKGAQTLTFDLTRRIESNVSASILVQMLKKERVTE